MEVALETLGSPQTRMSCTRRLAPVPSSTSRSAVTVGGRGAPFHHANWFYAAKRLGTDGRRWPLWPACGYTKQHPLFLKHMLSEVPRDVSKHAAM